MTMAHLGMERRKLIMDFLIEYKTSHDGCSPTIRQTTEAVGLKSHTTTWMHLRILEKEGVVRCGRRNKPCSIELAGGLWSYTRDIRFEEDNDGV